MHNLHRVFVLLAALVLVMPAAAQESGIIGPDEYPPNVNPLTGLTVNDPAKLERRPVGVKVSNYPPDKVQPQSGLSKADIVFQHEAEGGTTRFTAFFLSTMPEKVGSMRSARLIDVQLPAMYRSLFIFSGASDGVRKRIYTSPFGEQGRALMADTMSDPIVFRDPDLPVPHNFFANVKQVSYLADQRSLNKYAGLHGTAFGADIPPGGTPARTIDIAYRTEFVRWSYEAGFSRYTRWSSGEPHMDRVTNEQLAFNNVVVLYVPHVEDPTIIEDEVGGGHFSIEIQLWGEGPCDLFRDGQRFDCRWSRADDFSMLTFTDLNGELLPLRPGTTWYHIVRTGFTDLTVQE